MEGFDPAAEGPEHAESGIDYQPPKLYLTPMGMGVEKRERTDLEGKPTEVRVSFIIGVPPGIVTQEVIVRMENEQALALANMLAGGIEIARANEIPPIEIAK